MSVLSIGELLGIGPSELSGLVPYSAIDGQDGSITGINGSGISGIGGGADMSAVSAVASSYAQSAASGKVDQSAFDDCCSAMSAAVSAKLDATASSQFITSTAGLQPSGDYAYNSALSSKMDASASSNFAPSGDYAYNSSLSSYVPNSAISAESANWNNVSSKLDSSAFTSYTATATAGGRTYTGVTPIVVDNNNDTISLSANAVNLDSSLKSYLSGGSGYIGLTYPVRLVTQSSQATGSDIIYIVTGSN